MADLRTILIRDLNREVELLLNRRACAMTRIDQLRENHESEHYAHNLVTAAVEVAGIDGSLKSTRAILRHVEEAGK